MARISSPFSWSCDLPEDSHLTQLSSKYSIHSTSYLRVSLARGRSVHPIKCDRFMPRHSHTCILEIDDWCHESWFACIRDGCIIWRHWVIELGCCHITWRRTHRFSQTKFGRGRNKDIEDKSTLILQSGRSKSMMGTTIHVKALNCFLFINIQFWCIIRWMMRQRFDSSSSGLGAHCLCCIPFERRGWLPPVRRIINESSRWCFRC